MDGEGSNKKAQHSGLGGSNSHFPDTLVVSIDLKVKDDNRCISDNKCLAVSSTSAFMGHWVLCFELHIASRLLAV